MNCTVPYSFRVTLTNGDEIDVFGQAPIGDLPVGALVVSDLISINAMTPADTPVFTASIEGGIPSGGSVVYSLDNDAGGLFAIDPVTGVATLANPTRAVCEGWFGPTDDSFFGIDADTYFGIN